MIIRAAAANGWLYVTRRAELGASDGAFSSSELLELPSARPCPIEILAVGVCAKILTVEKAGRALLPVNGVEIDWTGRGARPTSELVLRAGQFSMTKTLSRRAYF